ncbi:hypothetical protein Bca52824_067682 [Brassica carinata]|uniref:Uncharacterized protein n=1 Tax=Brassica carinata TaxID=52824 RepID=A0A8X7QN06_BRACI|nr:hypothetical protein Bca52824_067682 [Brassica carinata]
MKTREEPLAEERDYKRRRMSYRGKKVKRTPRQVLSDMIEECTEEVKLAGERKRLWIQFCINNINRRITNPISNGKERIENIQWRVEPIQMKESGMRNMIQALAHRVTDHTSAVIEEMMNSQGPNDVATKRESYHQNHRSSREKSSSDYKTNRDDRYDSRQSKERRKQNSFEDTIH